ncbi:MAG: 3'-5' exonuclease [Kiritimatiellia bacterium]
MAADRQVWAFDCEWAPDVTAGRRLYHLGAEVPDDEVMRVMWEDSPDYDREANPQPFLKTVLCRIVSIATVVRVEAAAGVRLHLWTLPEEPENRDVTEAGILTRYLEKFGTANPLLVGYNSKNADMHILAQRAIVNGLRLPAFAHQMECKPWEMNAYDLMELVGGRGRGYGCSLNEIANLCGIPGKLDTTGDDVAGMFYGGKIREIVQYNVFDALTTYLLWLRVEHFKGTFTSERYAQEQQLVRDLLAAETAKPGGAYLRTYSDAWAALAG